MKKIFLINLLLSYYYINGQVINIPDTNFKTKLLQASVDNGIAYDINLQLITIDINGNNQIELNEVQAVYGLNIFSSSIQDLTGIEYFSNLGILSVNNNLLTNINLSGLTHLKTIRCDFNYLSSLDLTGLLEIEAINIRYNNFSSFNFNNLPNLKYFYCSGNHIASLDFSNNPLLAVLACNNNNLTSLNIKNGINQDFSIAGYNDCWKTGNPNLTTICVDASEVASVQSFLDGCGTAQAINITSNCGLSSDNFATNELVFFPNPTSSIITISSEEIIKSIELYDNLGRILVSKKVNESQTLLDVSNYSNGVYFVKVVTDNGIKIEKVIKQ